MVIIALVFLFYFIIAGAAVGLLSIIEVRYLSMDNLDPNDWFVRHFAKKRKS